MTSPVPQLASALPVRPADLPAVRAALLQHYHQPHVIDWWRKHPAPPAAEIFGEDGRRMASLAPSGEVRRLAEIDRLERAELFFVTAPMAELAAAAAKSLPCFDIDESDVPARSGMMLFEEPIWSEENRASEDREHVFIAGVSWSISRPAVSHAGKPSQGPRLPTLWLSCYIDLHRTYAASVERGLLTPDEAARMRPQQPRYTYSSDIAFWFGKPIEQADSVLNLWGKTVMSAWLLMQQKLARTVEVLPDRAARRRAERAGREASAVRVIELRRPESSPVAGISDREYHHQWIVRGHWRMQPVGPERSQRRPTWIAPHIKGPEGTPMLGGEKVYAWKR